MQEPIDLVAVANEKRKAGGLSLSTLVSLVLHGTLILWFVRSYQPVPPAPKAAPIQRYIELMRQNPQEFVEAPGPEVERAPLTAPLSDKNRRASMPEPTGDRLTTRPGDGSGRVYTPPLDPAPRGPRPAAGAPPVASAPQLTEPSASESAKSTALEDTFVFREPVKAAAATGMVDWRTAIRDAGRAAVAAGGGDGFDLGNVGGETGYTAEQGPLSFETQWYDWGDYAQSMVSKIRVNWYANMPQIIRTGMKGVVTIRFTIQRDGRITDITILESSGVPPYDLAARKAIELASPLKPLPKDFPGPHERVTCIFYYNTEVPAR